MSRKLQAESQKFSVFNQILFPHEFKDSFGNIGLLKKKKKDMLPLLYRITFFVLSLKLS